MAQVKTFKFWNVGEANAEIDRLETENEQLKAKPVTVTENPKLVADLATANQSVATLATERDAANTALAAERENQTKLMAAHAKALQDIEASVEARASSKALTIVASQGVPPLANKPNASPATPDKKDFSTLRGLDRAIAAQQAKYAKL